MSEWARVRVRVRVRDRARVRPRVAQPGQLLEVNRVVCGIRVRVRVRVRMMYNHSRVEHFSLSCSESPRQRSVIAWPDGSKDTHDLSFPAVFSVVAPAIVE